MNKLEHIQVGDKVSYRGPAALLYGRVVEIDRDRSPLRVASARNEALVVLVDVQDVFERSG